MPKNSFEYFTVPLLVLSLSTHLLAIPKSIRVRELKSFFF